MLSITYYSFIKPWEILKGFFSSFTEAATGVLDEDKPKIAFYAVMMAIQNFGFFIMYYALFGDIPANHESDCSNLRFWIGFLHWTALWRASSVCGWVWED